jgi:hypothetical protein
MTILEQLPQGARVSVIRLRSMGDCVLTTPGLALLKRARADLKIGVAVEDRFRAVFEGSPAADHLLAPTWQAVRRWRPTMCVNLHGGGRSQWIVKPVEQLSAGRVGECLEHVVHIGRPRLHCATKWLHVKGGSGFSTFSVSRLWCGSARFPRGVNRQSS